MRIVIEIDKDEVQASLPEASRTIVEFPRAGLAPTAVDPLELAAALREASRARSRPYYDLESDETARQEYYAELPSSVAGNEGFVALHNLLRRTHRDQPAYDPKRHVYPWVDLQPNGKLKSVYTGEEFEPSDFIEADMRVAQERVGYLRAMFVSDGRRSLERDLELALARVEELLPFNCEHVVPQSWFSRREPMRGDLHHLFACQVACNSFRGNRPYVDFPEFERAVRDDCGMWRQDEGFEPRFGKGPVARATLYFLLRYPGEMNRLGFGYERERIDLLRDWHQSEPTTEYERHRNAAIHELQGNRNPLIDFPDWVLEIDFERGLEPV